jgi:predicted acyltransferase
LHDLIQPSFSFLVGVALPFSIARRLERGQSMGRMLLHAGWRAIVLVLLGVFLRSVRKTSTYWTFEDTLSQIGLGYVPLFLVGLASMRASGKWGNVAPNAVEADALPLPSQPVSDVGRRWLVISLGALSILLVGYWAAFALYSLPGSDFDPKSVGVPTDWLGNYSGFAAHWNKNTNLAWAFDTWFLNLFPREQPFTHNSGGYATLSFIPTLGTMILGLIAGQMLQRTTSQVGTSSDITSIHSLGEVGIAGQQFVTPWKILWRFVVIGIACIGAGHLLDRFGICPSVKRIWTPAWTLSSGGWCYLLLASFYLLSDAIGLRAWSFPLRVIGANSIAAYCIAHLWNPFVIASFKTHLGADFFNRFGDAYAPFLEGCAVLVVYWLILYWMYRRGIFLRI